MPHKLHKDKFVEYLQRLEENFPALVDYRTVITKGGTWALFDDTEVFDETVVVCGDDVYIIVGEQSGLQKLTKNCDLSTVTDYFTDCVILEGIFYNAYYTFELYNQ